MTISPLLFISSIFFSKLANTLFQFTSKNKLIYVLVMSFFSFKINWLFE